MDKITLAGDVGGDVDKFIATQEQSNPAAASTKTHVAIDSLSDKVKPAVDKLADAAHVATHSAFRAATEALGWLNKQSAEVSGAQAKVLEATKTYVIANPLKAVGLGVLAGLVVARLLSSDDDSKNK